MFVRMKSYKNQDGSSRHYLFLVANKRIGGHVRQVTVANIGRVEDAEKIIPEMVEKISKFSKKLKVIDLAKDGDVKNNWIKEYGPVIIFKKLWEKIGFGRYFEKYLKDRKIEFDVEEIIYTMVLNRLIEPMSELATHEWVKGVYGVKQVKDLHQWYRALDFFIEHKDELELDLHYAQRDLFHQEIDMVLMDTTSVIFYGDGDKAEDILDYGFSKEKRYDLKQVIVGILMTKEGVPIGHEVYPGNTNDVKAFKEMIKAVNLRFKIRRVIIVCDRGMITQKNIQALELDGYEYIVGLRMRKLKRKDAERILSKGNLKSISKELKGKEVDFEKRRLIVCFSEEEAQKDKEKRKEVIRRLTEKLKTQGLKSILVNKEYRKYLKIDAKKPEINGAAIKDEEIFDGKFVLQTNTKMNWKEIVSSYKGLWQIESAFRTLKSELEMGPIYHYTERRIRAHIFICFLALLLKITFHKNLLEIDKTLSLNKVLKDIKKIKATQIVLKRSSIVLRTELEGNAFQAFKAVGLKIPPRLLSDPTEDRRSVVVRL